jgi:hypothetical protein
MFNFRPDTDVPGFRVGMPDDEPGFNIAPDGSPRQVPSGMPQENGFAPSPLQPVAAGDLACQGIEAGCQSGGDFGTTAAYRVGNRNLCMKCALKKLGLENEPGSLQPQLLLPWSLQRY